MSDFVELLTTMEGQATQASDVLHRNERRRKIIDKTKAAAETIIRLKPIHDTYMKKGFKFTKERYAEEHRDELSASKRAYAFLMKHHGEKLKVEPHEFDTELAQMAAADTAAQGTLDNLHDDLAYLRKLRYCVSKIRPELVGEKKSLTDFIQDSHADRHRQAVEPQKQVAQKRNVDRSDEGEVIPFETDQHL